MAAASATTQQALFVSTLLDVDEIGQQYSPTAKVTASCGVANNASTSNLYPLDDAKEPYLEGRGAAVVAAVDELATMMPNGKHDPVLEKNRRRFVQLSIFIAQHAMVYEKTAQMYSAARFERKYLLQLGCSKTPSTRRSTAWRRRKNRG